MPNSTSPKTRARLMAAAASIAIAGAIGFSAVTTGTAPVLADAVRIDSPQAPGFADVVERVSPAVVSVRVKAKIEPASDDGSSMQGMPRGFDDLPDNHPMKRFFKEFRGDGEQRGDRDNRSQPSRPGPAPGLAGLRLLHLRGRLPRHQQPRRRRRHRVHGRHGQRRRTRRQAGRHRPAHRPRRAQGR